MTASTCREIPEELQQILQRLAELPDDCGPEQVDEALTGVRHLVEPSALTRELLVRAVTRTRACRAPARLVDDLLRRPSGKSAKAERRTRSPQPSRPTTGVDPDPRGRSWPEDIPLIRDKRENIKPTQGNALLFARYYPGLRGRLRYNSRYLRVEWSTPPAWGRPNGSESLIDEDAVEASAWIASAEGVSFTKGLLFDAFVTEARVHAYDPVYDYLEALRWDGWPRVASWLAVYLGTPATPYSQAVGRAWLISAVARVFRTGCKADCLLVLEGPQGTRKSSALATLAGPHFAELSLNPESKDCVQDVHGPWIIEWAELAGLNRKEAESVKSFLSRKQDRFRAPYGRTSEDLPRRCVFAGSTNERCYLNDPTGARRYWPVPTQSIDLEQLAADRDQLWAEAVALFLDQQPWWLSPELESLARGEQVERTQEDTWTGRLEAYLDGRMEQDPFVTTEELVAALDLPSSAQHPGTARRLSAILTGLGWERGVARQKESGRQKRGYRPAENKGL